MVKIDEPRVRTAESEHMRTTAHALFLRTAHSLALSPSPAPIKFVAVGLVAHSLATTERVCHRNIRLRYDTKGRVACTDTCFTQSAVVCMRLHVNVSPPRSNRTEYSKSPAWPARDVPVEERRNIISTLKVAQIDLLRSFIPGDPMHGCQNSGAFKHATTRGSPSTYASHRTASRCCVGCPPVAAPSATASRSSGKPCERARSQRWKPGQ